MFWSTLNNEQEKILLKEADRDAAFIFPIFSEQYIIGW